MADASNSPFGTILTPGSLNAQREAQHAARTEGLDYWVRQGADAGFGIRQTLRNQGYGLTDEDRKAQRAEGILAGTQKYLADMVGSGEVDPMDAQEIALTRAMSEFMGAGDYEAAQSFLPQLSAIRKQREELNKLKSEVGKNVATAGKEEAIGIRNMSAADLDQYKKGGIDADIIKAHADARAADARARLLDRTDPNLRAAGRGTNPRDIMTPSAREKLVDQVANTVSFYGKLGGLYDLYSTAPGGASLAGKAQATVEDYVKGFESYAKDVGVLGGYGLKDLTNEKDRKIYEGRRADINRAAKSMQSMGVSAARIQSLIIDLAFSLARANDPGGRLSDNDFKYSLEMLGALQNPAAAKAVFQQVGEYVHGKVKARQKVDPAAREVLAETYAVLDDEYANLSNRWAPEPPAPVDPAAIIQKWATQ